jgi:YD repeat-containing protein
MGGAKVTLRSGIGGGSGGGAYVVTSRNVYSSATSISQSNYMSYIFSNGSLFVDSLGEAGGNAVLQGFVTKVFQPSKGVETTYLKDANANVFLATEDDFAGGRLTAAKTENPSGHVLAESDYSYDDWGNVAYSKNNIGQQTWLSYANTDSANSFGSLACYTAGFYTNPVSSVIHDRLLGKCDFQNGAGSPQQRSFFSYGGSGNLLETRTSHGGAWLIADYTYDPHGNVASINDADGNVVYYTYSPTYGGAYLTKESRVVGTEVITTLYGYDFSTGFLTSTTNPNGQTTTYAYDAVGRMTVETYPAVNGVSSVMFYSYDDTNGVVAAVDPNLHVVKEYFDGLGRETRLQVFDDKGKDYSDTYYSYNWMDKVSQVTLPSGSVYSYSYDSVGRSLSQTNPDGTSALIVYNNVANSVASIDEDTNEVVAAYDWNGRVTGVTQYPTITNPATTSYVYDASGNLLSTANPDGQVTRYSYDDVNRLTKIVGPDGNSTSYAYDNIGNLISKTTPNGATIRYEYDSGSRLINTAYPDGTGTLYTYDLDGNPLMVSSILSGATTEAFTYDALDRLTSSTTRVAGGSYTTSYAYDQASNLISTTYPDGLVVPMNYDFANRLTSVGTYATSISYHLDNTIQQITFGDKETQSYTYDSRDRATSIADSLHKLVALNLTYAYDAASNVVKLNAEAFGYDGMNRLTSATGGWGTTSYNYDGAGNMLASTTNGATTGYAKCGYYPSPATANNWMA